MRLSEAIRLGAMLKPQTFNAYMDKTGTCALGAALDAEGLLDDKHGVVFMVAAYENQHRSVFSRPCPACEAVNRHPDLTINVVIHLNDDHRWTREQIADWVATMEAQHEPAATAPSESEGATMAQNPVLARR